MRIGGRRHVKGHASLGPALGRLAAKPCAPAHLLHITHTDSTPHTRARADAHTLPSQLDWRALLPRIAIPCLNCMGGSSGVFPVEGCLEVGRLIPDCCSVVFDRANHW